LPKGIWFGLEDIGLWMAIHLVRKPLDENRDIPLMAPKEGLDTISEVLYRCTAR
jgi:hypothetical protein